MAEESGPLDGAWWRPMRSIGDIAVFHVDLTAHAGHEAEALAWLDGEERLRWQSFRNPNPRRRYVLCRAALRGILGHRMGFANDRLGFATTQHGKPFATVDGLPASVSCNVSHSGQHGLVAVAPSGLLGVDVEERAPRRHLDRLIKAIASPDEHAAFAPLRESQKLDLFFRLWTLKEALAKAHGKGISMDVSALEIPVAMRRGARRSVCRFSQIPGTTWILEDLGTEEFAAAVAYEAE